MPPKTTAKSRALLRRQYGSRYIPDSNPSSPGETEPESDLELEPCPNSESQVPSSMVYEHEIPVPLRPYLESETQPESQVSPCSPSSYCQHNELQIPVPLRPYLESETQPESQVSPCSPSSYCQHTDSETFTLPSAVKEFRDMFEGRWDMFDEDFPVLLADSEDDGGASFEGREMIKEEQKQQLGARLPLSSQMACTSPQTVGASLPTPTLISSIQNDSTIPTVTTQQTHKTMTPHNARKHVARLSRELLALDSLQKRTRKLYHRMLILSRG
ncbi:hypothetical protein BYT27DRAFT_7259380 [Phlegmacium glaucopus]|nr:hypothetical protein BYT27DRAFT_7259380 [Phlegmacium glaucopus]